MPHYKDGTEASVGDHVIGKPYNTDHEVAGTVVSITPSADSCNLQVEFIESVKLSMVTEPPAVKPPHMAVADVAARRARSMNHSTEGEEHDRFLCRDYGEVKAFTLVARPSHAK